jgi:uncharacterized protein (DUF1800 family)
MDRRAFLTPMSSKSTKSVSLLSEDCDLFFGLNSFTGPWTNREAAHLLRRTVAGADFDMIQKATEMGMDALLDTLLSDIPLPSPPLNYNFPNDPNVPEGETWIGAPFYIGNNYQHRSFQAWLMGTWLEKNMNIRDKMVLFWHNHFVISNVNDARFTYRYIMHFMENPLGNFKELVEKITIDPGMLRYLDGRLNRRQAPNENYARELFELFTIGKGDQESPGDYSYYTEEDVVAASRVLTGWIDFGFRRTSDADFGSNFVPNRHDTGNKQFSHRFGNAIIQNEGAEEYKRLIDMIFDQQETARFICRKLYRWFVYYKIDDATEQNIIAEMANILRANNFEIRPVLKALLKSEHFYSPELMGVMIKNPLDFMTGIMNALNIGVRNPNLRRSYNFLFSMWQFSDRLQMQYFNAPDVAGWKAYYQEPSYYQSWINSVTIQARAAFSELLLDNDMSEGAIQTLFSPIQLIESLSNPYLIDEVLKDLNLLLFPKPFTEVQIAKIKEVILPGLPDYEWSLEYELYRENPNDMQLRQSFEKKIVDGLKFMLQMPEFQLS